MNITTAIDNMYYCKGDQYHRSQGPAIIFNSGYVLYGVYGVSSFTRQHGPHDINIKWLRYNNRKGACAVISYSNILSSSCNINTGGVTDIHNWGISFTNRKYDVRHIN